MKAPFLRTAGAGLLVSRPNGLQYGHLGLEILMSLAEGRAQGMAVCFLQPRRAVNRALFSLTSDDVLIVRAGVVRRSWLRSRMAANDFRLWSRLQRDHARELIRDEIGKELSRQILAAGVPRNLRDRLKRIKSRLASLEEVAPPTEAPPYLRRRLIRQPVRVRMRPRDAEAAESAARELGIAPGSRIVTLHAREAGYKRGMEVQEKHARLGKLVARDDSVRNARIETCFEAIDYLVARGYTIVRIGDPTMTPVRRPGVVDLATAPRRYPLLDVQCLLASEFLISGEAGPVGVSYLTNTPLLNINATDPISSYPVRSDGLCLLKHVSDRSTGRELTAIDLLSASYMAHVRDSTRFRYRDNTPEEILAAVQEMIDGVDHGWRESSAQAAYRDLATRAAHELRSDLTYVRKWGADEDFLGDGRMARSCVEH